MLWEAKVLEERQNRHLLPVAPYKNILFFQRLKSNPRATQSTGFEYLDVFAVALLINQPEINYRSITISEVVVAMNPGGFC